MKILCCGSRYWSDLEMVAKLLTTFPSGTTIIHGAQKGADWMSGEIAKQLGYITREYPADWDKFGKGAGPIRNQHMLDFEHKVNDPIRLCLAFHDDDNLGVGTADMVRRCTANSIPVRVVRSTEWHKKFGQNIWK